MKKKLTPIPISMPVTLVDLIDDNAPKSRSDYILSLIERFYQHPVEKNDLSNMDTEGERVAYTLRLTEEARDQLEWLCQQRYRNKNTMVNVICLSLLD